MPTTSDQQSNTAPRRFIVDEPGIDTELGIKGRGYSPDNGQTFFVQDTTDGRVYRLLDAKRLYPLLKPMFDQVYNSGPVETSLHWADILDKPDLITKQQLDDRLTAFTPAVSWDQVTGKPDLATQDDLKKIELTPGPPGKDGKDGSPGRDGKDGAPGKDGKDGKDGQPGKDGKAATVRIGTVEDGDEASVTNSGTDTDAVLNFVLPVIHAGGQVTTDQITVDAIANVIEKHVSFDVDPTTGNLEMNTTAIEPTNLVNQIALTIMDHLDFKIENNDLTVTTGGESE